MYLSRLKYDYTPILVIGFLAITTTLFLPLTPGLRVNRQILLGLAVLGASGVVIGRWSVSGACLALYVALRCFFSSYPFMPIHQLMTAGVVMAAGLLTFRKWEQTRNGVYNAICLIALVNVAFEVLQALGVWYPLRPTTMFRPVGLMANPDETSALLGICAPFFFRPKWVAYLLIVILGLILSQVAIGAIAACAAVSIVVWRKAGFTVGAIIPGAFLSFLTAILVVSGWDFSAHLGSRWQTWTATVGMALQEPVFGWGFGSFKSVMPAIVGPVLGNQIMLEAHNEFVELFFCGGIVGLLFAGLFAWRTIRRGLKQADIIPVLSFIAALVTAIPFFTFQIVSLEMVALVGVVRVWGIQSPKEDR